MRARLLVVAALLSGSCGSGSPTAPASPPLSVTGAWSGTSNDSQGVTVIRMQLTQAGSAVTGTVATQAPDPTDGSCNACHRNKTGTFSGTLSGTTLTMLMTFAAGIEGDPTPICSATMTGSASEVTPNVINGQFTGSDTCEGAFLNGVIAMRR